MILSDSFVDPSEILPAPDARIWSQEYIPNSGRPVHRLMKDREDRQSIEASW